MKMADPAPYLLTFLLQALTAPPADSQLLILGQPTTCQQECDYVYNPVCGTDSLTYPNFCFLLRASCNSPRLRPQRYGSCTTPDSCNYVCDRSYKPVCGSDGTTYSNPCVLMYYTCFYPSRGLFRRHVGRCVVEKECPATCPRQRTPVCGSDDRTYTNECFLMREACAGRRVTKARNGACPLKCPRICTREYLPVCGDDNVTYPNTCTMESTVCEGKTVTKAYDGPCDLPNGPPRQNPSCNSACPFIYAPVCGSDGKTYGNNCALNAASCKNPAITKVSDGECVTSQRSCPQTCPDIVSRVCGSDGITYENECILRSISCNDPTLTVKSQGTCENEAASSSGGGSRSSCPSVSVCPTNYSPVCGSDGTTYPNQCNLDVATCLDSSVTWRSDGLCPIATSAPGIAPAGTESPPCANTCSRVFAPVCGSDGETYFNLCLLNLAACNENRVINAAREGRCVPSSGGSSSCDKTCPFTYNPVCGNDGVTYSNPCSFDLAVCKNPTLIKVSNGAC
ncbi:Serine protease inhibitor dipetalogastin-like 1 [Homarus americanus]|uniref:Serine protease inhibitor dipetalogastin-like 1 n=1 Tax=Homarus americanus TaxID=6706 RepID=A0A8J5MWE5_HOMAM|nr:Serine protease inhibitor dipetalogastin-like 1 [Homarus americanus]